ncbi:hypothetical protein [Mesorhizobium sp. IMUNJ 23232]|uniref:hypothetical protein n=1 Tax=Mesorhizobium sp. IMUNJ 23232 TaxID=3376064 RepID=UPI0037A4887F
MRTAIVMTATLTAHASRKPLTLWNALSSMRESRRSVLPEAERARDDGSGVRSDGLEALDFLYGWKGRD